MLCGAGTGSTLPAKMGSLTEDVICVISHGGILACLLVSELLLKNNIMLEIISAG